MSTRDWLADIVLVNDSPSEVAPGDVLIFRSFDDARSYLEHWSGQLDDAAFFASGDKLIAGADAHGNVVVERRERQENGQEIVKAWLHHSAQAVLAARLHRSGKRG